MLNTWQFFDSGWFAYAVTEFRNQRSLTSILWKIFLLIQERCWECSRFYSESCDLTCLLEPSILSQPSSEFCLLTGNSILKPEREKLLGTQSSGSVGDLATHSFGPLLTTLPPKVGVKQKATRRGAVVFCQSTKIKSCSFKYLPSTDHMYDRTERKLWNMFQIVHVCYLMKEGSGWAWRSWRKLVLFSLSISLLLALYNKDAWFW